MLYGLVVFFLLFFCFPIPGLVNSVWVALGIALVKIAGRGRFSYLYRTFCSKYVVDIIVSVCVLIGYSYLVSVFTGSYDFSRMHALVSLLFGVFLTVVVYSSLSPDKDASDYIEKLVIGVFVLQAVISLLAFGSPAIRELVAAFQFEDDADLASESYSGFRGLAMSGRLYFEFSATCGLIVIMQIKRILDEDRVSYRRLFELLLLIVCGFFAGRTSLVGLAFGCILVMLYRQRPGMKMTFVGKSLVCLAVMTVAAIGLLPGEILEFVKDVLLPWVFDVFIKLCESGSTQDSFSLNTLNEMYETVQISSQEWIVGSGNYMNPNGTYYKQVDAGYLRQVLYWGVVGSIINLFCSLSFFRTPWRVCRHDRNNRYFLLVVLFYTLTVHYKGDLLGISRFYYTVLFMYLLDFVKMKKEYGICKLQEMCD